MANGYIGKISALVTASTADLSRKLQGSTGEVRKFAASVQSQVTAASRNAQNSLNSIFTPLQKLERALKAANGQLNLLKPGQAAEIRAFVSAAEGINKPLAAAQRQFAGLSSEVAGRFIPALNRAQEAALQVNEQITRTGTVAAQNFREAQRAVEAFAQSQARVAQIDRAATSGRTGREAEFVSPRALQTLREAAALSERASQLSPAALQDGGVARQVQRLQTFRNAIAQTVAEVEQIRLSPQVDTAALAAAERRLDNIVETTRRAQQELEQIVNGVGQSTDVSARLQSQFEVRQAVEEEAAFRQRAADAAERETKAVERLSQAQNRLLASEIDRTSGAASRRNAASFDAATAGLLKDRPSRSGVFERQARTIETELARTAQLRKEFLSLPEGVQQSLEAERAALNNIGTAARDGAAGLGTLTDANDRMAASIEKANEKLAQQDRLAKAASQIKILTPDDVDADNLRARDQARQQRRASTEGSLGLALDDPLRQADVLTSRVAGLKSQLDTLPASVRSQFVPALKAAEAELVRISVAGTATPAQIKRAADEVRRLEGAAVRAKEALSIQTAADFIGNISTKRAQGELLALQQVLARVGAQAGGPVAKAYDALAVATRRAIAAGTTGLPSARKELERLQVEAAKAAAATGKISFAAALKQIRRGGDVATKSFQNVGLAVNQLAFAVDDFFSVTGGIEQRIRAIGNNITQFGVIIGQTKGLVIALAAVLVAQGVVALIKWRNAGTEAQDRTKALNEALERQKTIVDQLRESFESLASSLADGVFSAANRDLRNFEEQVRRLQREQQRARDDQAAARDPRTAAIGADISVIDRALQGATDPVRAQILARRRRELEESSERVRSQIAGTPAPTGQEISDFISAVGRALLAINQRDRGSPFRDRSIQARGVQLSRLGQDVPGGESIAARSEQLRRLRDTEGQLAGILDAPRGPFGLGARIDVTRSLEETQREIALVDRELSEAIDAQAVGSLRVIRRAGDSIEQNIQTLEEAVTSSVTGAAAALAAQESFGEQLRDARDRLAEAAGIEDSAERARAVEAIQKEIVQIEAGVRARADEISAINTVRRAVDSFAEAVGNASGQLIDSAVQDASSRADQARRQANLLQGQAERGPRQRGAAELVQQDIAAQAAELRREQIAIRGQFEQAASGGGLGRDVQQLIQRRAAAQAVLEDRDSAPRDRVAAEGALEVINDRLQRAFEQFPEVERLAELADALDAATQGAAGFADAVAEGRNLVLTDSQRAADDFLAQVQRLNAALEAGEIDRDQRRAAIDRLQQDGLRQLAPTIFGLADQVQNAVLQGPSRAALEATDVSTVEGSRELNRLLRGDDDARNQPLIELQREANKIAERIARGVENNEAQVAQ